ncbi:hypothetical protein [Sphingomonas solaris]|uniref:DUF1007 family protein n=1 Tax=Alterirhizorhabdus solaris TaxID=2529389 RepID=A0A558R1S6_9SPHN|nr:hypothetical protein [Sphingomonas solaris]TVV73330.1 hypothetical protein FOY91_12375 [Sphingomonas solaris]
MIRHGLAGIVLGLAAPALAHPHSIVEQQASLSLGRRQAVVSYAIMPSWRDGAHMFAHLDSDGDGLLSRAEQTAFAWRLLATTRLTIDGVPARLALATLDFPERAVLAAGGGPIRITARASLALAANRPHLIAFDVRNHDFAASWFLQPYYFADLMADRHMPKVGRHADSGSITVAVPAAG